MRQLSFITALLLISFFSFSQTPGLQWQRTIGGTADDVPSFSFKTNDNAFITVSVTYSNDGDVSGNHGNADIWVSKMNFQGQTIWNRVIGGSSNEIPRAYYYNTDGTMIILGNTTSNDGDVTGNHGGTDIWVSKLAADGSSLWHTCYGGSGTESAYSIIKSTDGSYVIAASTNSNDGNITGNHGARDLWVFDIDESSNLQWQRSLGGTSNEVFAGAKLIQSSDNSYYVASETFSNDGDVSGNAGDYDMWLVKLNTSGVFQWQKCLGGLYTEKVSDVKEGQNGQIYVCGTTNTPGLPSFHWINTDYTDIYLCRVSSAGALLVDKCYGEMIDDVPFQIVTTFSDGSCVINSTVNSGGGDVVGYHGSFSGSDIWLFKVKNDMTIEWQRSLGGFSFDGIINGSFDSYGANGGVTITADQGYVIAGFTGSPDNGDVMGYHPTSDSADADLWITKLNATGTLQWQKTLGGFRGEWPRGSILEIAPGDYIVTAYTNSKDGDIQTLHGTAADGWMLRVGPANIVKGTLYYDQNSNGVKDGGEPFASEATVTTQKTGDIRTAIPVGGLFLNETDTGAYTTTAQPYLPYYNVVPSSHSSPFTTYFNTDSFSLALQPIAGMQDLVINVIPLDVARPGFNASYKILYKNAGTVPITSGEILFKKDSRLDFVSAAPAISSSNGDTLKWSYTNLNPLDTASIQLTLLVQSPPLVNLGDTLISVGIITPVTGDQTPLDDTAVVKQIARASFDPNDKYENNEGKIFPDYITSGKYLNYLVRFQNVGSDTAFNITIRDTLSTKLNLSTLQVVAASHLYSVTVSGNVLIWTFHNIRLPYSSIDEPASHGFIAYRIKPNNTVTAGDTIHNTAGIYFDFNLPVATNDAFTVVVNNIILPVNLLSFTGAYKDDKANLYWSTAREYDVEKFVVERSLDGAHFNPVGDVGAQGGLNATTAYNFTDRLTGIRGNVFYYRLKMIDNNGSYKYSRVLLLRKDNSNGNPITVNPNPVNDFAVLNIRSAVKSPVVINIVDVSGRIVIKQADNIFEGNNAVPVNNLGRLQPGYYTFIVTYGDKKMTASFIIRR